MTNHTRRSFLSAVAAAAAIPATAAAAVCIIPSGMDTDPVFAAIERHKLANRHHGDACDTTDTMVETFGPVSPEAEEAHALQDEACTADLAALRVVLETVPATASGMVAYLDHIASPLGFEHSMADGEDFAALLATVRQFAERLPA
ncbi:hypothetical protein FHS55_001588 [Angulomicrobium tetraedrale]|uniref:Twin-arginine translocation signal domain-containing protein n=1 Tax=Ancylobacter tetraedralis TaxID=217068 RepID=A0A839Z7A6_9HYPH|nr:hypothetical protein [Ancylobacter tetraedralis]MBB3770993.1 hypothetical protein [Ancylobacter tetraedralis]